VKIIILRSFEKDANQLPLPSQKKLKKIIQNLSSISSLKEIDASKLKGGKNAYRIRFGNYCIGFYLEENQIILSRLLSRKDIYKYFPKK
jgi:mRNA interferase RelE/StbE